MFDIGFWEISLLGLVGLMVLGPERLPAVARVVGGYLRKARRTWANVRTEIESELAASEIREAVRKPMEEVQEAMRQPMDDLKDLQRAGQRINLAEEEPSSSDVSPQTSPETSPGPGSEASLKDSAQSSPQTGPPTGPQPATQPETPDAEATTPETKSS